MSRQSPFAARYAAFRRDIAMLRDGLAGRHAAPFTVPPLPVLADVGRAAALAPRTLSVARVVRETDDAVSLELVDPKGLPVPFIAGQFFTVILSIDGEHVRRAYSACSSPLEPRSATIAIKRVASGKASNWLNDHAREGMLLEVLGPSGSFVVPELHGDLVLLAGGSGITPMMAILRETLATKKARIVLVYGNRSERDVIFRAELERLADAHPGRLVVRHVLGAVLDERGCALSLDACSALSNPEYFVCGPEPMMVTVRRVLEARGVPAARIHEERFLAPHLRKAVATERAVAENVVFRRGARERAIVVGPGQTLLEAGLLAGEPLDFSCAMGGCGACKVKLASGDVAMEEPNCLTREERAAGYVLACVGRPRGPVTLELA